VETQVVSSEGTYSFGYDEMSRNNLLTFPDGHTRAQRFDDLGRITSRCYDYAPVGGVLRCYTANYDAVGNPVRMTDPDGVDVLTYDALDRLMSLTRYLPDGTTIVDVESYTFNALGALKTNAGVVLDDQRPRLDGGGTADAAVPNTTPDGKPVALNGGGFVTSLHGTTFSWTTRGPLREAQDPIPALLEHYGIDSAFRRVSKQQGADVEFYYFEGMDRVATLDAAGAPRERYLFDGIDHPLRVTQSATSTTAYYEVDIAGNVRHLFASGGTDLGGYRYTAFGKRGEDTTTITQPLRWKGRWFSSVAGGIYDVRARQWAPEMAVFLAVDEFEFQRETSTLWGWPGTSPLRFEDPSGHYGGMPCPGCMNPWCVGTGCPPPKPPPPPPPPTPKEPPPPRDKCTSDCRDVFEQQVAGCDRSCGTGSKEAQKCGSSSKVGPLMRHDVVGAAA
jgi:RHS repeat-associated protein